MAEAEYLVGYRARPDDEPYLRIQCVMARSAQAAVDRVAEEKNHIEPVWVAVLSRSDSISMMPQAVVKRSVWGCTQETVSLP